MVPVFVVAAVCGLSLVDVAVFAVAVCCWCCA